MTLFHADDKVLLAATFAVFAAALAYGASQGELALALVVGGLLALASVGVALLGRGQALSQLALPVLGMAMVGLAIHSARGQAEAHFAVFALLAATVVYRHWRAVAAGAAAIALHHLSFNYFQQWGWGAVCFIEPGLGHVLAHAAYVGAESALLLLLVQRARAQDRSQHGVAAVTGRLLASEGVIDLTQGRVDTRDPTARKLIDALRRIEASVVQVRGSAQSIGQAASGIAQGNAELSQRTEQTAGSLRSTASAIDQLAGTVRQTAESARSANQLAASASSVAQRGGSVVSQVVATMTDINTSSKKIADIIGTIDGIAFQTNILALNAAVEAARAGEQGRGFAVVASEVRSLAQRSAEAARQIKGLIGASVERVGAGTRLVADAGSTMTEIVASVQRVSDIIGEISAAAAEQSNGIGQVNAAVAQLDQATQQNAALVEHSAAAAASLTEQSRQLIAVVAAFRTDGAVAVAVAPVPTPTPTPATATATATATRTATSKATSTATPTALAQQAIASGRSSARQTGAVALAAMAATPASAKRTAEPARPAGSASAPAATAEDDWESF